MPPERTLAKKRADRAAQQKKRGSRTSPATEAENAKIVLAWEAGELTAGQTAAALDLGYVATRELRDAYVSTGILLAGELKGGGVVEPIDLVRRARSEVQLDPVAAPMWIARDLVAQEGLFCEGCGATDTDLHVVDERCICPACLEEKTNAQL